MRKIRPELCWAFGAVPWAAFRFFEQACNAGPRSIYLSGFGQECRSPLGFFSIGIHRCVGRAGRVKVRGS